MGKNLKAGFSLVEILIALVIIGIALLTIATFIKNSALSRGDLKGSDMAYLTGNKKLIELKAMINPTNSRDTVFIDDQRYIRDWTITTISGASLLSIATVNVQFQFLGKTKSISCSGGID